MSWSWGGALKGAGEGLGVGLFTGNPYAAGALALGGGVTGGLSGGAQDDANKERQQGMQAAMQAQQQAQSQQMLQRGKDLRQAQSYFAPAADALQRIYGIDPKAFFPNGPNNSNVPAGRALDGYGNPLPISSAPMPKTGWRNPANAGQTTAGVAPPPMTNPFTPPPQQNGGGVGGAAPQGQYFDPNYRGLGR